MDLTPLATVSDGHVDQLADLYPGEWWRKGRERPDVETMLRHCGSLLADAEGILPMRRTSGESPGP